MESRAFAIAAVLDKAGKGDIVKEMTDGYGEELQGVSLEEIIGDNPIHQFLSGLIAKVQVFESQLVEASGDAFETALAAVEEHGRQTATQALGGKPGPDNYEDIYRYINDYQLEGMPCDPSAEVDLAPEGPMSYAHSACNHIQNWRYTGVDIKKMCDITNTWLKGFVNGLNDKAQFSVDNTIAKGANSCGATVKM